MHMHVDSLTRRTATTTTTAATARTRSRVAIAAMKVKMKRFNWMRLLLKLCWWCFIFIGLMFCPSSAQAVNTNCSTLVYDCGRSASVTCFFSHDLRHILKNYGGYLMEHKTEDGVRHQVFESYWITPDKFQNIVQKGYSFISDEITDRLTVYIPQFTDQFKGKYHCSLFPPHNVKEDYCILDDTSPTAPVDSTVRSAAAVLSTQTQVTSTETQNHSTSDSGLVLPKLGCVIGAALVPFFFR